MAVGNPSLIKGFKLPAGKGEKRYNYLALMKLAEVLDLELYFGPPRETGNVVHTIVDGEEFAEIDHLDIQASAGHGRENGNPDVIDKLAFKRDWLTHKNIDPNRACLIDVHGDSMLPSLSNGDLALVDQRKNVITGNKIYALTDIDGTTLVKRLEILPDQSVLLKSDNPEWPTQIRKGQDANRLNIIGEIVWSGHSWK